MRTLGLLAIAAGALAAVQVVSPSVLAQVTVQAGDEASGGTVVQVGPERGVEVEVNVDEERLQNRRERRRGRRAERPRYGAGAPVAVSRYWIGLGGGPVPAEIRAQIDIEPGAGVLVREVTPDGPAAEAGVEQYDILLSANGKPVRDLNELADLVGEQGELKGRITLDLLRRGRPKTVWVTPAERPVGEEPFNEMPRRGDRFGRLFGPNGAFGGEGFGGGGIGEMFGPGGLQLDGEAFGGLTEMIPEMAGAGVSVQVQRQNEGPAQVTVHQGDKTWQFDEGDQDALEALPADVRLMVDRILGGQGRVVGEDFEAFGFGDALPGRMRALQERMMGLGGNRPPAIEPPAADLDEAPAFGAAEVQEIEPEVSEEPIEIEIPSE